MRLRPIRSRSAWLTVYTLAAHILAAHQEPHVSMYSRLRTLRRLHRRLHDVDVIQRHDHGLDVDDYPVDLRRWPSLPPLRWREWR